MSTTIHSITAPKTVQLPAQITVSVTGISINDAFATDNSGEMLVTVSCNYGTLQMLDATQQSCKGSGTNSIALSADLATINQALATLNYSIRTTRADNIHLDVWNQAGQNYTADIGVVLININPILPTKTLPVPQSLPPPQPTTNKIPSDPTGVTATRVADLLSIFGVNTFYNGQGGGDASVAAHVAGFNYICGDSGVGLLCREYARDIAAQTDFCQQISQAVSGLKWIICVPYLPCVDAALGLLTNGASGKWLKYIEGFNEPNNANQLGGPAVSPQQVLTIQQQLFTAARKVGIPVVGPAIADLYGDPKFIQNYFGATLTDINKNLDFANGHDYPNSGSPSHELQARTQGISALFGNKSILLTEFHAGLYNHPQDEASIALYTLTGLLSGFKNFNIKSLIHFCNYDYQGFSIPVGLFNGGPDKPHPVATAMRALFKLTGDMGTNKFNFAPGKLDIVVNGLPAGYNQFSGGQYLILQNSVGTFFIIVWNEQDSINLSSNYSIQIDFNKGAKRRIVEFSATNPVVADPTPKNTWNNVSRVTFDLATEVKILQITV